MVDRVVRSSCALLCLVTACEAGEPAGPGDDGGTSALTEPGATAADGASTDSTFPPPPGSGDDQGPPPTPSQTPSCADWVACAGTLMLDDAAAIEQMYGPDAACWDADASQAAACDVACREAMQATAAELEAQGEPVPEVCDPPQEISWSEVEAVLRDNCVDGCHEPGGEDSSLDLGSQAYFSLYQVASEQSTLYLVDPGSHDDSYLWHKLAGSQGAAGGMGGRMPKGEPPLDPGLVESIADWIDRGAPNF